MCNVNGIKNSITLQINSVNHYIQHLRTCDKKSHASLSLTSSEYKIYSQKPSFGVQMNLVTHDFWSQRSYTIVYKVTKVGSNLLLKKRWGFAASAGNFYALTAHIQYSLKENIVNLKEHGKNRLENKCIHLLTLGRRMSGSKGQPLACPELEK